MPGSGCTSPPQGTRSGATKMSFAAQVNPRSFLGDAEGSQNATNALSRGSGLLARGTSSCTASAPDALQCLLDMRDRRLGQDAGAGIEDQRPGAEILQHAIDRAAERRTARAQRERS